MRIKNREISSKLIDYRLFFGILVVFAAAMSGCVPGPAVPLRMLTQNELQGVNEVREQWESDGREEIGDECESDLPRLRVAVATTHPEMMSLIGYVCGPSSLETRGTNQEGLLVCRFGRANGAYRRSLRGGIWPFALMMKRVPLFVVWHALTPEIKVRLIMHEAEHWLEDCTGRGGPQGYHGGTVVP